MIHAIINRYKNLSKPAKASLWFIACYVIQRGLQFIGMPIYTRIMSQDQYGVYSVFLSWFNLICIASSLNIYDGTFNKAMVKYEETRDKYISSVQGLTLISGVIVSSLLIIFHKPIFIYTGYSFGYVILFIVHLLLFPTLQYWNQKQRFLYDYKKLVFVTLINSVLTLGLGVFFVLHTEDKSFTLVSVTVIVHAIISIILFISITIRGKTFYHREYWSWSTVTALPLIPHYLAEVLLGHADRLMISQMCGDAQAAIYNIVYQISMVMTIVRTGINGSFTPWLYYSLRGKKYGDIRRVSKMITILMAVMSILFMLLGPEILKIVAPPEYYEAVVGIPAIMIGCFFIFVFVLFTNVEIYYEKNQFVSVASMTASVVNLILNYFCIKKFGYISAAYTTMISYMIMALMHYYFLRRIIIKENLFK